MALFSELLGRLGNEDIDNWLQLHAWQQSVLLAHSASDVIRAHAGVATATTRYVIGTAENDSRLLSAMLGKLLDDSCYILSPYIVISGPTYRRENVLQLSIHTNSSRPIRLNQIDTLIRQKIMEILFSR